MCKIVLDIDENEVCKANPSLTDTESITRWAQRQMDNIIADLRHDEENLKPYTMAELNAMLDEAEADFAAGRFIDDDDVWREYDEERAREKELQMAVAV